MNDWQLNFLQKLESAKKQWLHKFEQFALNCVEPVFAGFENFTTGNGFRVTQSPCEPGLRIYKFSVTENGYVLVSFRMRGLEEVEACCEVFAPGLSGNGTAPQHTQLSEATQGWAETQFQCALDEFIIQFGEAGSAADNAKALVTA